MLKEVLAAIGVAVGAQQPSAAPGVDGGATDAEGLRDLVQGEQPAGAQAPEAADHPVRLAQALDAAGGEEVLRWMRRTWAVCGTSI